MNYGYPQPPPQKSGMGPIAIIAIVLTCMFGGCMFLGALGSMVKKHGPPDGPTAQAVAPLPSPIAKPVKVVQPPTLVDATTMFADYHENEVAADDQYKGRSLLVSGNVAEVKKDFTDSIIIHLRTSNQFIPIDAHVEDSEKSHAARLVKGVGVRLLCKGNGLVIGRPQLVNCTFAE